MSRPILFVASLLLTALGTIPVHAQDAPADLHALDALPLALHVPGHLDAQIQRVAQQAALSGLDGFYAARLCKQLP